MALFTPEQEALFGYAETKWSLTKRRSFTEADYINYRVDRGVSAATARRTLRSFVKRELLVHSTEKGAVDPPRYTVSIQFIQIVQRRLERAERAYLRMLKENGEGTPI